MIKIGIIEDNIYSRIALEQKLSIFKDIEIVLHAQNGSELLKILAVNNEVDLILMDIEMPILNGIDTTLIVKKEFPNIKIVMITMFDNDEYIFNAIKSGADSYILKETKAEKIHETILDTLNGGAVMSPSIALKTLNLLKQSPIKPAIKQIEAIILTEREIELLALLSQGFTNKMIAAKLFISPFTVKRHIENIYKKLQVKNRIELIEKVRKKGLL
ncbi:MAG TPA: response regulator transcription factor [Edaphocola sp.]|nr:response regulator transcription factor [Edaphocola sp.]